MRLKNTIASLASLLLLTLCGLVSAQSWPDRPVKVIVPYAPGGGVDPVAVGCYARADKFFISDSTHIFSKILWNSEILFQSPINSNNCG